ncbi:MAG: hypothetical protein HYX68_25885 [Planctomycetes bacterium]|nr:hypothetical protein [Planctomycetota bacterium]
MAATTEQLEAIKRLDENWDGYGAAAPAPGAVDVASALAGLIDAALRKSFSGARTLHASPTRIGGILLEWEDHATEHEIEITPDGSLGFLHRNKATGEIATRKISPFLIHLDFLRELQQVIAA